MSFLYVHKLNWSWLCGCFRPTRGNLLSYLLYFLLLDLVHLSTVTRIFFSSNLLSPRIISCEICNEYSLPITGVGNIFCTGQDSKHLGFAGHTVSVLIIQLCCWSGKRARENTKWMRGTVIQYFICTHWNLNFIQFSCGTKYYSSFDFLQSFKNVKAILPSSKNMRWAGFVPWAIVGWLLI